MGGTIREVKKKARNEKMKNQTGFTLIEILIVVLIVVIIPAWIFFVPWIFMKAWNLAAVPVFHAPIITYWQAFGIWLILSIIGSAFRAVTGGKS